MLTSAFAPIPDELGLQVVDVARHLRPDIGVHARCQRALVLAELGQHVARQRHREAGVDTLDDRADLLLVRRVDVRVDQPHGERLDTRLDEVPDDLLDLCLVDGDDRLTVRVHPLDRLPRVCERGRRVGLDHDDPARQRARRLRAGEMEDLAEALRRDQTDAGAFRLQHGVGGDGRAVEDVAKVSDADVGLFADPPHADQDALGGVVRRRRGLHAVEAAAVPLGHEEEVGERAADVDPQPVCHLAVLSRLAGDRSERAGFVDLTLELPPEL